MDAYAFGTSLGKHHPKDRDELLEIQKQAILKAASEGTKGRFGWLALIKPPTIMLSLVPLMWLQSRSAMDMLLVLAAIIVLVILNYASNTSYRTLRIAERFGYSLHQEMVRLVNSVRFTEGRERIEE
jgi:hypothetical protein